MGPSIGWQTRTSQQLPWLFPLKLERLLSAIKGVTYEIVPYEDIGE